MLDICEQGRDRALGQFAAVAIQDLQEPAHVGALDGCRQGDRHGDLSNGVLLGVCLVPYRDGIAEPVDADLVDGDAASVGPALHVVEDHDWSPAVRGARRAGFADHDPRQRKRTFQVLPDPPGEVLASRVVEPFNLVEVVMIEHLLERLEGCLDIGEVHDHAADWVDVATDVDFEAIGVAVQTAALVSPRRRVAGDALLQR